MNCKPGDLAIIVGVRDERCRENIGAVVEVKAPHYNPDEKEWKVIPARPLLLFDNRIPGDPPRRQTDIYEAWILDRHLMPINGPPVEDTIYEELGLLV